MRKAGKGCAELGDCALPSRPSPCASLQGGPHPEKHSWKYLDLASAHALLTHQVNPIRMCCLNLDGIGFLIN